MMEMNTTPSHDVIMMRAHQMRAEAMRNMFAALFSVFRRKSQTKPAHV